MTYSKEKREVILTYKEKHGLTFEETAKQFDVSSRTLQRWSKRIEPKKHKKYKTKIDIEELKKDIANYPDSYQFERAEKFNVSKFCIYYHLKKLKISCKKKSKAPESR